MTDERPGGMAVNIGNTRIALGVYRGDTLVHSFRLSSRQERTEDEIRALLDGILSPFTDVVDGGWAALSSVVPARTNTFIRLLRDWTGTEPLVVTGENVPGLQVDVPEPAMVGSDRIVNAVAAAEISRLPCIVVDLGTATNIEVVGEGPRYLGGIIAPGIVTAAEALFQGTARLGAVELNRPDRVIGKTTRECLQSGVVLGAVAQIDGLVAAIRKELGSTAGVIGTGGLAAVLGPESKTIRRVVPELTLEGLRIVAERSPVRPRRR